MTNTTVNVREYSLIVKGDTIDVEYAAFVRGVQLTRVERKDGAFNECVAYCSAEFSHKIWAWFAEPEISTPQFGLARGSLLLFSPIP